MGRIRKLMLATVAAVSFAGTAQATNISFTGNLAGPNDVLSFAFSVASASTIELRSYSYAGGVNAAGTAIARGGFDPILSLYNSAGVQIGAQDDSPGVPADSVTGARFDVDFSQLVTPGSYTTLLTAYSNFCGATLATPVAATCPGGGSFTDATGNLRDSHFAFDILNVNSATQTGGGIGGGGGPTAVPEPASLVLLGAGLLGLSRIRRKVA